jgi:hypothetical protein
MMKRKFCKRLLHIKLIGAVLLFGYSVPSSADMFSIAEEKCVSRNHEKGSASYSECILNVLRERQFQKPSSALVHDLKTKIDAGNKKYWGDAVPLIVTGVVVGVGVGLATETISKALAPKPTVASSHGHPTHIVDKNGILISDGQQAGTAPYSGYINYGTSGGFTAPSSTGYINYGASGGN